MSAPASKRRQPSAAVMAAAEAAAAAAPHAAQHAPPPEGAAGGGFGDALFAGPDADAGGANGAAAAAAAAPGAAAASPVTRTKDRRDLTDAERRDRRLQQNRLAAKRSYNKRVQRQAEMEQEYEKLRTELEATNNQVSTLGNYIAKMPVFAHLTADPTWHQIMAQHPIPGANAAPQAAAAAPQPQYPQAQMQQQFGTAEAAAVFQQQAAGMAQMPPPPVPTHGAVQPGLDNGGWPATKTESLTVPVASAAQNGAGGSPPGAAGVAVAAAAGVAPMQVPGVAGQAPGQIVHGTGPPPMVPVPSIVVNSDRVVCVATATIDLEQCLASRPFNRWASTLDPKFRLVRLTFTAAEVGEAGVTSVSMQAECTDRATGRPLSASVLLRDEAETQKVGLLVLLEPEGGAGPYAIATRQPRLSVGIFESLEIPLAEARGDDVLFSAGPGDAAALAQEAGLNLASGGRPIDLCALVQAEASPGGPAGKHGVWLTPGTDDTTRVFLCRQSCSQTELQMLASRLARPSESQPGRVPAPLSGVKTEGLDRALGAERQLVVVPYADLRSSRDIRTLCATALYERVAPRLPPLASLADGGRGMWPRSQNKQAAAARAAAARPAQGQAQAAQQAHAVQQAQAAQQQAQAAQHAQAAQQAAQQAHAAQAAQQAVQMDGAGVI